VTPTPTPHPDVNNDGMVNATDLAIVGSCVGQPPMGMCAGADVDGNGVIDIVDVAIVAANLTGTPTPTGTPTATSTP
jgi:hypothetical protein